MTIEATFSVTPRDQERRLPTPSVVNRRDLFGPRTARA